METGNTKSIKMYFIIIIEIVIFISIRVMLVIIKEVDISRDNLEGYCSEGDRWCLERLILKDYVM